MSKLDPQNFYIHTAQTLRRTAATDIRNAGYLSYELYLTGVKCRIRPTSEVNYLVGDVLQVRKQAVLYFAASHDIVQNDRITWKSDTWEVTGVLDNNNEEVFKTAILERV